MKSVNLTYSHKELQFHMFAAITFGFQAAIAKGYFLTFESTNDSFIWKVYKSATAPENGDAKDLHSYPVNKGVYQLNDVRLGIVSKYLEDQCWRFLQTLPAEILKGGDSGLHFTNFHSMDEYPEVGEDGYSNDVLIDLDGWCKDFRIGYYDKDNGWEVYQHYLDGESTKLDLAHGTWTYLPINKGNKVEEPQPSSGDITQAVNSIMDHFKKKEV